MVHHDCVSAKLASEGSAGRFDIIEFDDGIKIFEDGFCNGSDYVSVEAATVVAQELADAYDKRKLEDLKAQWKADPSWEVETTDGFEDFRQELYIFRLETELDFAKKREERLRSILSPFSTLLKEYAPAGN
jgi:hypothetical protein